MPLPEASSKHARSKPRAPAQASIPDRAHRSGPMHDRPAERRPRPVPLGASRASNMLSHESVRQLDLTQLTHLSREGNGPGIEAEEAIWHIAASELLNHDSMRQIDLSQVPLGSALGKTRTLAPLLAPCAAPSLDHGNPL
jgi:hypothetical protein